MAAHTIVNLEQVEDSAPKFGMRAELQARFATEQLEMEHGGVGFERIGPNFRVPFGHRHQRQEEVYVVVGGGGRIKLDDEIVELSRWDAVRVAPQVTRCLEAGPDGLEVVVFGAPHTGDEPGQQDGELEPGWWAD
jgi:mannose-6-phosphate isomerase-like protein (cupin superfamily)